MSCKVGELDRYLHAPRGDGQFVAALGVEKGELANRTWGRGVWVVLIRAA